MTVLASAVDTRSPEHQANRDALLAQLEAVAAEQAKAVAGGGPKYVDRHRQRGKMLIRERIEALIDEDSPFLELSALAGWGSEFAVGASAVTSSGQTVANGMPSPCRTKSASSSAALKCPRAKCNRDRTPVCHWRWQPGFAVTSSDAVRYFYGTYDDRASAEVARREMQYLGFEDAFVVGEVDGRIISAEEAERLLTGP